MIRRNLERKARCPDLEAARVVARQWGATLAGTVVGAGTVRQVDTYFRVVEGRLKLRQSIPGEAELIAYRRPDLAGMRASDFVRMAVDDPDALRATLALVPGVLVEVRKVREVWLRDNVRLHFDTVDHLGTFLEYEVGVDGTHPEREADRQAEELDRVFGLSGPSIPGSYADLLLLDRGEG